jgi:hypothetical protein
MKNKTVVFPCRVRQGFFAFIVLFAVCITAAPQVNYSIIKSSSSCRVRISGSDIGTIKNGEIVCEYAALDIDEALVYSPLSSMVVGASVDRLNHRVKIVITTTGKVTIDNTEIIVIEFKLSGSDAEPLCKLTSAVFTDSQGAVKNALIIPLSILFGHGAAHSTYSKGDTVLKLYLLNGKAVPKEIAQRFQKEKIRGDIFLRIVTK